MKLVDCFMYFDEDLMTDIRLNVLNDQVDRFVIAEATMDHAGNKKNLNFDRNKFKKFEKKIQYVIVDDLPKDVKRFKKNWSSAHVRDQFQRNALERGYSDCSDEDLIMISDLDEIPRPEKIKEYNLRNKYACFVQKDFQLKLNLHNTTLPDWGGTKICQKKNLKSPQWLRNIKNKKYPFWKFYKPKRPQLIYDGGWHFSFVKTPQQISQKLTSYAEQQFNNKKFNDVKIIKEKIDNNKDLLDRDFKYEKVEIDYSYPKYIRENKEKLREFIL